MCGITEKQDDTDQTPYVEVMYSCSIICSPHLSNPTILKAENHVSLCKVPQEQLVSAEKCSSEVSISAP